MGRKLDLGVLTEEEEKRILDVIKRDNTVRKVESDRIGFLSKVVEKEEEKQKEVVRGAVQGELPIDTLCAKCGSKFMWLINPKCQCGGCDLFFCKNKIDCIVYDKITQKCFCGACLKQRDLQSFAGEWFYSKLKGKFRRHGGAKVSRELQKKNKEKKSETASPSSSMTSTPVSVRRNPSTRSNDTASLDTTSFSVTSYDAGSITSREDSRPEDIKIEQNYDVQMDAVVIETTSLKSPPPLLSDMEIQTDDLLEERNDLDDRLPAIKEELEAAISKILIPKLDELKRSQLEQQTEVDRQQKVEDAVKLAEEMIDKALERARDKHDKMPEEENILLTKYLSDSKTEFMDRVALHLHDESMPRQTSNRSSLREAGTMTETSDSELESLSSSTGRKRTQKDVPLSERLGSLSPDSLRKTLDQSQNSSSSSMTQGIVLKKDQMVARADIDNALEQILDEHGVTVHGSTSPHEFSTELKFTAVGGGKRARFSSGEVSEDSDDEARQVPPKILSENENWSAPELQKRPSQFGKTGPARISTTMMSLESYSKSPYEEFSDGDSDSDKEHVHEEQVLASLVRRPDGPMSPQSLVGPKIDVVESLPAKQPHLPVDVAVDPDIIISMRKDLQNGKVPTKKPTLPDSSFVIEELIQATDRGEAEFQTPEVEMEREKLGPRTSGDSAYHSDYGLVSPGTPSSESELSAIPEADHEEKANESHSDSDESDTSSSVSERWRKSSFLQPQRHSVLHDDKKTVSHISYEDDLLADRDEFGDRMAAVLAQQRQRESFEPQQTEVSVDKTSRSRSSSESSESDVDSEKREDSEDDAPTPTREKQEEREILESSVALRIVNGKALDILTAAAEKIDAEQHESSDSESDSSKTCSVHENVETMHEVNEAEENIYRNAAKNFMLEERVEELEQVTISLDRSDPDLRQTLDDIDAEVKHAEDQMEEIRHGNKSIDAIVQELQGAGLQVHRGGFKRTSLDSASRTVEQKKPSRYSLPPMAQTPVNAGRPVNATDPERPSWAKNTFTVVPGSRSGLPSEKPTHHSTPKPASSTSSSSSNSTEDSSAIDSNKRSPESKRGSEIQATINALLNGSSHYSMPTHPREKLEETTIEHQESVQVLKSASSHSSHSEKSVDSVHEEEIPMATPRVPIHVKPAVSSRSASSIYSSSCTSISSAYSEEEMGKITYTQGLSAEELEEARVPTPVPRRKKEALKIEETVVLTAVAPVEREPEPSIAEEEEKIPATDFHKLRNQFENIKSSSESGSEYTDPLIKEGMGEEVKVAAVRKFEKESSSSESENTPVKDEAHEKRKSRIMEDDSWMKKQDEHREEDTENSDTESVTSSASKLTAETSQTDRSSLFQNLTAAEQREMARKALLLPETPIAEDRYQTKQITFVRTKTDDDTEETQREPQKESFVIQQDIVPSLAPPDVQEMVERDSSSSSSAESSPEVARRKQNGTQRSSKLSENMKGFYSEAERAKFRQSFGGTPQPELDRALGVRGSITMRGGKMVMTTSPDAKIEFQVLDKRLGTPKKSKRESHEVTI